MPIAQAPLWIPVFMSWSHASRFSSAYLIPRTRRNASGIGISTSPVLY